MVRQPSKENSHRGSRVEEPKRPQDIGPKAESFDSLTSRAYPVDQRVELHRARFKAAAKIVLGLPDYEKFSFNELLVLCLPKMPGNNKSSLTRTIENLAVNGYLTKDEAGYISINSERLSEIRNKIRETSEFKIIRSNSGGGRILTPIRELVIGLDMNSIPSIRGLALKFERSLPTSKLNSETIKAALLDLTKAGWLIDMGKNTVARCREIPSVCKAKPLK
jgi:hypothetical protein